MRRILDFLRGPIISDMDVDSDNRLTLHRKMLEKKRMLREVFTEFHHLFRKIDHQFFTEKRGIEVELGSGVSSMRDTYPEVLATDILDAPHLDKVVNAEAMDFADNSIRAIYV